jgi:hypothetical protein
MNTNHVFSLQRFSHLFRRHLLYYQKTMLIGLGAMAGLLLVISILVTYSNQGVFSTNIFETLGIVLFFLGGYLITSQSFNELHSPSRGQFFLTLPASSFEKLFTAWLVSAPVYIVVGLLSLWFVNLLAALVNSAIFGSQILTLNLFSPIIGKLALIYLITQSVFFLGAVYFRRYNFLKTLLSLFVIQWVLSIWVFILMFLFFDRAAFQMGPEESFAAPAFFSEWVPLMARILFWGLMAPFFLVVSYLRLKEREV